MCSSFLGYGSVVDSLFIVAPIFVGVCVSSMFCCAVLSVVYSFAIILLGKRESWLLYFHFLLKACDC